MSTEPDAEQDAVQDAAEPDRRASATGPHPISTALLFPLLGVCALFVVGALLAPDRPERDGRFAALAAAEPVRLTLPALGVSADVVPIEVSAERVLDPPADPAQVGWWNASTRPGTMSGQTVITGHSLHTGQGALNRIDTLEPDQRIDVATGEGTMRYRVTGVERVDKDDLPARAESLFGQDQDTGGRLVLVSCDDWNGTEHETNVVVFGEPLGQPVTARAQAAEG